MPTRPVIIGIVGDSGSGKSTLARGVVRILGADRVTHVCADDYHKFDRAERGERGITALHPLANHLDIFEGDLERLAEGRPILKPVYDHTTGRLRAPEYIRPREFIVVEGLLGYHSPTARALFDVRVYLDPAESVRRQWKIARDSARRGYTVNQVLAELDRRQHDSATYIRPQRQYADIVVQFTPPTGTAAATAGPRLDARLVLRPTLEHPELGFLLGGEVGSGDELRLILGRDGSRPADFLEIDHRLTGATTRRVAGAIAARLPNLAPGAPLEELGEVFVDGVRGRSQQLALVQLLLSYHALHRRAEQAAAPLFGATTRAIVPPITLHGALS